MEHAAMDDAPFVPRLAPMHELTTKGADDHDNADDDAWLAHAVAQFDADEAATPRDAYAYTPQLMDAHAMQLLRRELRTGEARVRNDGHLREFVPRKPAIPTTAMRPSTQPRRHGRGRHFTVGNDEERNNHDEASDLDPFVLQDGRKREFADALRTEVEQLNALYDQYDATKRLLLDHLDTICSTKPSERTTSHEVYERLNELLAFAATCAQPLPNAT